MCADIAKIPPPSETEVTEYASITVLSLGGVRRGGLDDMAAWVRQPGSAVDGLMFGR